MSKQPQPQHRRPSRMPAGGPQAFEKPKNFKKSLVWLLRYLKPYLPLVCIALCFAVGAAVIAVLAPDYLNQITEAIYQPFITMQGASAIDMAYISRLGIILAVLYGANFLAHFVQTFIMSKVNQKVCQGLRTELSQKINRVPLKYFDRNSYGDVLSRITNDIDTIGQTLNQSIVQLVTSITLLIGVLIAMMTTSWQLGLTALATIPVSFVLILIIIGVSQRYFKLQQASLGEINGHIEEMYSGAVIVKAFNGEQKSLSTFNKISEKLFFSAHMAQFLSGLVMPAMGFIGSLGIAAICAVGSVLVLEHSYGLGTVAAFFIYVRIFQNALNQLSQVSNVLQGTVAAGERVFEFLEEKEYEDEQSKTATLENVKGAVEFDNVCFSYEQGTPIIKNFSVKVKAGQKVAIVGPTGAGKTTLVNLLMRFYETDSGTITIDGVNIKDVKREQVRAQFGMVLQDAWLFEGTVRENIIFNMQNVSDEEFYSACKTANIDHFVRTQQGGYDLVLGGETTISNGQKQLLTIARAMIQNSPMLILDEATSSVDTRTEQMIQEAMDKLTKGRTSFVIAHRLSTIKNADIILVLNEGDIVETGTHAQLIEKDGFYAALYKSQFVLDAQ